MVTVEGPPPLKLRWATFAWTGRAKVGAEERTRTSTTLRPPAPEAGASANSATSAQGRTTAQAGLSSIADPLSPEEFFELLGIGRAQQCGASLDDAGLGQP